MNDIIYEDDIENNRRLGTIEASISQTLLYDLDKKTVSCKSICIHLIYILAGFIILTVVGVLIVVLKK